MQKVKISKRVGRQLYRSSPTILTVVASVGVVTTTIMAVRATPKAIKILKEAELEKGEDLSKLEIIRAAGPIYIPSVLLGVSTIACIFGANALNQKKQASLMSAYAMLNESYKQYRKAGATLIAAINEARKQLEKVNLNFQNHVLVVAQDIDEIVALMCYIQLSLLGVAAYIKVGDVFTQPMSTDDNGENYWFTMMYFSDVWTMRRVFHSL